MHNNCTKRNIKYSWISVALVVGSLVYGSSFAVEKLTPQDLMATTIINKSVINGKLAQDAAGNLLYDPAGNARFQYTGNIYSIKTDEDTGELTKIVNQIGVIEGEAAFPTSFVGMSAAINWMMGEQAAGRPVTMPPMPAVVAWTCNSCKMTVAGSTYISIVDALHPDNLYGMNDKFDAMIVGGAAQALTDMRLQGRAFLGTTPVSYDPFSKTMSIPMAGCSAVVAIAGPQAGKLGVLCMNSTATFDVSQAVATLNGAGDVTGYTPTSQISANGTSNCTMVLHTPTM